MPIDWRMLNTQFPQQLSDLFNPAAIQQRQAAVSDQQTMGQLRQAQLMQAAQGLQRAPELARRTDVDYKAKQDALLRQKLVMGVLQNPQATAEQKKQALLELYPEKAAEQAFKPEAVKDYNQPFGAGGVPNTAYQKWELEKQRAGGTAKVPMAPVAYVDEKGNTIWGTITEAKGKQAANYSPTIQGQIAGAKSSGKETGTAMGESVAKLQDMEAMMPRLEVVAAELSALGKKATYTMAGQGSNFARRELGMNVGEGAIARKEYISKVDNEILPLLRQTFGAQFTQKEGESLKATLGDTNASPEEKDAVLKSFIETKYGQIAGLKSRTGATGQWGSPQSGGAKFLGFE